MVEKGLENLKVHIENLQKFNINIVVCLNKYNTDYESEIEVVDIKYSVSVSLFSEEQIYCFSALIMYKK